MVLPHVADLKAGEWLEHARFSGIYMKSLLTSADNPLASVNAVQIPPGGIIGRHHHAQQLETVWVIKGEGILTLEHTDIHLTAGQVVAIPTSLEHALRNETDTPVELLTFFTPPLP
jgi:quercetin dioxygenase-like cupin family protein